VTTTRQGWLSALEPAVLLFTVVVCCSLSLLAYSGASVLSGDALGSENRWLGGPSGALAWTAESQGHPRNSPDDDRDIDDNDDDDDAGALPGMSIILTEDQAQARHLIQTKFDPRSSLRSEGCSLRGPPRLGLDELTYALDRHIPDQIFRPPAWTAADSHRHPRNSSDSNRDDDIDDRDRDDDDDDDKDDGGALSAMSIGLTTGRGDAQRVIQREFGARLAFESEAHSLRGPPHVRLPHPAFSLHRNFPDDTSLFSFAADGHSLRAPPRSHHVSEVTSNQANRNRN